MGRERNIIAPHLEEKELEEYRDRQKRQSEKGIRRGRWEVDPNEEYQTFLPILEEMIREEQQFAGVSERDIESSRVHYFRKDRYSRMFGASDGIHITDRGALYVNMDARIEGNISSDRQRAVRLRTLLHESIHHISHSEDMVSKQSGKLYAHRAGYMMSSINGERIQFRGLNEAVTEKTCATIFARNSDRLVKAFPTSKERDWIFSTYSYPQEGNTLEFLTYRVAEKTGREASEVWEEYMKGMVNGDIKHLKEVDRVYGPGSLRFLASMGAKQIDNVSSIPDSQSGESLMWTTNAERCFRSYFGSPGKGYADRYRIVQDVLNYRELSRFRKENGQG